MRRVLGVLLVAGCLTGSEVRADDGPLDGGRDAVDLRLAAAAPARAEESGPKPLTIVLHVENAAKGAEVRKAVRTLTDPKTTKIEVEVTRRAGTTATVRATSDVPSRDVIATLKALQSVGVGKVNLSLPESSVK